MHSKKTKAFSPLYLFMFRSSTSTAAAAFAIGKRSLIICWTNRSHESILSATSASSNPRDEPPEVEAARNRKESVISSPATMRVLNVLRFVPQKFNVSRDWNLMNLSDIGCRSTSRTSSSMKHFARKRLHSSMKSRAAPTCCHRSTERLLSCCVFYVAKNLEVKSSTWSCCWNQQWWESHYIEFGDNI